MTTSASARWRSNSESGPSLSEVTTSSWPRSSRYLRRPSSPETLPSSSPGVKSMAVGSRRGLPVGVAGRSPGPRRGRRRAGSRLPGRRRARREPSPSFAPVFGHVRSRERRGYGDKTRPLRASRPQRWTSARGRLEAIGDQRVVAGDDDGARRSPELAHPLVAAPHRRQVVGHRERPVAFELLVEVDRVGGEDDAAGAGGDDDQELAGRVAADLDRPSPPPAPPPRPPSCRARPVATAAAISSTSAGLDVAPTWPPAPPAVQLELAGTIHLAPPRRRRGCRCGRSGSG